MSPARRSAETTDALRLSLVEHALRLVARDGAAALTMRALAAEAGCAVGLPYKVFADRRDLVTAVVHAELERLRSAFDELLARAGRHTVGGNLTWFADVLLDSPAVSLGDEVAADATLTTAANTEFHTTGLAEAFDTLLPDYLAAEQRAGRVDPSLDGQAFGFLVVGALHNLLVSGPGYPKPSRRELRRLLDAAAAGLAPRP